MNHSSRIESEIKKTLECFHEPGIQADPLFYEKICRRLSEVERKPRLFHVLELRPLRPVILYLLLFFNLVGAYLAVTKTRRIHQTRLEYVDKLSSEYMITESAEPFPNL